MDPIDMNWRENIYTLDYKDYIIGILMCGSYITDEPPWTTKQYKCV